MKPVQRATTIAGFLCLLAFLLLASPGVRVVRAAGEGVSKAAATSSGGSCNAGAAGVAAQGDPVEAFLAQVRSEHPDAGGLGGQPIIVLNSRGYNYGPPPSPDLSLIELEARRQRGR